MRWRGSESPGPVLYSQEREERYRVTISGAGRNPRPLRAGSFRFLVYRTDNPPRELSPNRARGALRPTVALMGLGSSWVSAG